jgi:hypothetical protein
MHTGRRPARAVLRLALSLDNQANDGVAGEKCAAGAVFCSIILLPALPTGGCSIFGRLFFAAAVTTAGSLPARD